ncbi:MAG: PA14 domain-containing protein [Planctomycetota bacterium]|nr:PA14 domain-containing protein [Planctomycetota bacterium]MDA1211029.1 PA14 domain-containing protein [Planctomycetota bacterium]
MRVTIPTRNVTAGFSWARCLNGVCFGLTLTLVIIGGDTDTLGLTSVLYAQADDGEIDDEDQNGLILTLRRGEKTIQRVEDVVSVDWQDRSPDPRLAVGNFSADWNGRILIRQAGKYRLHQYLSGTVSVAIDGNEIVFGRSESPSWITSKEFELDFGEHDIHIHFEKTASTARIHLFWSSEHFPLEPVSASLFYRDALLAEARQIERGREQFDVHRCGRCHWGEGETLPPAAPSLELTASGVSAEWLLRKLLDHVPKKDVGSPYRSKMPHFQLSVREAQGIVVYLNTKSKTIDLPPYAFPEERSKNSAEGRLKLLSLGCLACHHVQDEYVAEGRSQLWNGGSLASIGLKRTPEWLSHWLRRPQDLNTDHRMPTFSLEETERQQLVLALSDLRRPLPASSLSPDDLIIDPFDTELVEIGARVLRQKKCFACHRIPQFDYAMKQFDEQPLSPLSGDQVNWNDSCIADMPLVEKHPKYDGLDREAIRAFVASRGETAVPPSLDLIGQRSLEQNNCLACHPRSTSLGLTPLAGRLANDIDELRGRSSELIPPTLTAVGDKLFDTALIEAIGGQQPKRRLPWLQVRMPKYEHSSEVKIALAHHLIGRDRIPAEAPVSPRQTVDIPQSQQVVIGHTLVGGRGFSCIACHTAGNFQPRGVALGSRGSDLLMLQTRMRKEYFLRWTRSPLRIVQGVEMPSYQQPKPMILNGNLDAQLDAIWLALNDGNFTVPTNPGSVEQYLVLKPGSTPRVVRDVFTLPLMNDDEFVPRAFAVGLANGHSLLFDLDRGAIRQWTIGDFARQRTQGKSWFWDMAGITLMTGIGKQSDIVLARCDRDSGDVIDPVANDGSISQLVDYEITANRVEMNYRLTFLIDDNKHDVVVNERYSAEPPSSSEGTGWLRSIRVGEVPDEFDVLVRRPVPTQAFGEAGVTSAARWNNVASEEFARLEPLHNTAEILLKYHCSLQPTMAGDVPVVSREPPLAETVRTVPGFDGVRLPIDAAIMPTAMTWTNDGTLAFTSLRGDVYLAKDSDGDGLEDTLTLFETGLAAPFGLIADGDDLIISHKPELLRLCDTDADGHADVRDVLATGWGYTENYHDWTCGIVRDSNDRIYVALGSDYGQPQRPRYKIRWRGKVLRIDTDGTITPVAHDLRFPTGLAIDCYDRVFISDQQGVQNTFNELNLLVDDSHYGVPSQSEIEKNEPGIPAAIQIPHPWTRSVNGIAFIPQDSPIEEWRGQGIGCEYDTRFLIRYSVQQIGNTVQGAVYPMSLPDGDRGGDNFVGPIAVAVSPEGDIYIGSIHDSGWQGGINTGAIERLTYTGELPPGIQEVTVVPDGIEIAFTAPVNIVAATRTENYSISGYTRVYQGGYATPDTGRFQPKIERAEISDDCRTVWLHTDELKEGFVYEIHCGKLGVDGDASLWPSEAHYTLHRLPAIEEN